MAWVRRLRPFAQAGGDWSLEAIAVNWTRVGLTGDALQ